MIFFKHKILLIGFLFIALETFSQYVVNDVGLRLSISAQKKINEKVTLGGKILTRQIDNVANLNRAYARFDIKYNLHKFFDAEARLYYMYGRKGYKTYTNSYRYSFAIIFKTKLSERFSLSNRLTYQVTNNYFFPSELTDDKSGTVVRDRISLTFKHTRRGSMYIKEEGLFQLFGKKEKYFGRNRVYLGYKYKFSQNWDIDAYFILQRTHGGTSAGPQERTFFYGVNLGYKF